MDTIQPGSLAPAPHPWLTGIPANWRSGPLKRFITSMDSGVSVNAFDIPAAAGQLGVLKTSCVYSGRFDATQNKTVVEHERDLVACPVRVGALIVSRMNTPDLVGAAGLVQEAAPNLFLPDRLWQVTFHGLLPRFAHYWTQSGLYRASVNAACAGTSASMQNLSQDDFRGFPLAAPCWQIQVLLADILDSETARIDALIEKKTRFIELLQEKRQALITQAVTRGLDPNVPTKDSGVDWLGQVPRHWAVTKIKRLIRSIGQGWSPECEARPAQQDEWGVLKVGCVNGGVFRPEANKALPPSLTPRPALALARGDVLVSRANTRELVGSCAVVMDDQPRLMLCDKLYRLVAADDVDPEFMAHLIAVHGRRQVEIEANGASASMVNIAQDVILDVHVPVPPLAEQKALVRDLRLRSLKLNQLVELTAASVELLREHRSALITAAVTGQIDAREAA